MVEIISGSFFDGCGLIVWDTATGKIYHTTAHTEPDTGRLYFEITGRRYYK